MTNQPEQPTTVEGIFEGFEAGAIRFETHSHPHTGKIINGVRVKCLKCTLTTLQATHEAEKRELVREIKKMLSDLYNSDGHTASTRVALRKAKALTTDIATRHNIDLSDPTEGSK